MKASLLIQDYTLYPRAAVDPTHVGEMVRALETGAHFPPLLVEKKSMRIVDGFHRHTAYQKWGGPDVEIQVELEAMSDATIFQKAMKLNAAHGRTLAPYDRARCIARGEELGLSRAVIASSLVMTIERLDSLYLRRYTANGQVLKHTLAHLAGKPATAQQLAYNERAGGMNQAYYINQVVALLESDAVDWKNASVKGGLTRLQGLLRQHQRSLAREP